MITRAEIDSSRGLTVGNVTRHPGYVETRYDYANIPGLSKIVRQFHGRQSITFRVGEVEVADDPEAIVSAYNAIYGTEIRDVEPIALSHTETGINGVIYVGSPEQGRAPCVNWYATRAPCLSVTIEHAPIVNNHGLPRDVASRIGLLVAQWVQLNHDALTQYLQNGASWSREETNAHFDFRIRELELPRETVLVGFHN